MNNLSNLLAQDDKKLTLKNFDTLDTSKSPVVIKSSSNSIKSLTLPGKSSHTSPHSAYNAPTHLSVRNVNFQLPNKTLSSSSVSSLNKSTSASDSSIQEKSNELIRRSQQLFVACLPYINLLNVNSRDIEETWRLHVMSVFNKKSLNKSASQSVANINILDTFFLFKKLFKESRRSLNLLMGESCDHVLQQTKVFASVSKHFMSIIDLVNKRLKCPLVYFDQMLLLQTSESASAAPHSPASSQADLHLASTYSIVDKHRKIVWEIGENFDTFVQLRKSAFESLDKLKRLDAGQVNGSGAFLAESQSKLEKVGYFMFASIDLFPPE